MKSRICSTNGIGSYLVCGGRLILKMRWWLWSLPSMVNPQKTEQNREILAFLLLGTCLSMNDPCDLVDLDFSTVEYISRSFADQFHFKKINLTETMQKKIIATNASEKVINMLQAIAKTQNMNRSFKSIPVYKYSDGNSFERFLLWV